MEETKEVVCVCGSSSFRVNVKQTVDVEIRRNQKGFIEIVDNGCDFSNPEIQDETVHCADCGEIIT
jgi:hypothetical protein